MHFNISTAAYVKGANDMVVITVLWSVSISDFVSVGYLAVDKLVCVCTSDTHRK